MSNSKSKKNDKSESEEPKENNGELKEIEQELVSVNPEIVKVLNSMNKSKREAILRSTSLVVKQHSGPLPDPETLREYNDLIPNGAERIMVMAEKQQSHGIGMEKTALRRASFQHLLGQIFAFILAGCAIWFGYELTYRGFEKAGITIFATTIAVILYTFVLGRRARKKD